ncbi:ADP-ribose pyrophosphatase [candidate division LCP-89 bacterium B3_LCP]|uniref:GDP-mannose pyrophosphatase n=1 Tax=candidate division LCP-89 bacterium B3_LCP TaxID=2012998 RepID=A0A532US46_UNCL8|nr:MAG: ADP-ribose pyrophosphatase [candidate division LCP-89 bacterium B3_LCP]
MDFEEKFKSGGLVFDGKLLKLHRDIIRKPDGREEIREVIRHPGAAVIVPRLRDGRFVLVRQFRYALNRETVEFPAGKLDPGEDPLFCAQRELKEETGYYADDLKLLLKMQPAPAYSDEILWIYSAEDLTAGKNSPDSDELVSVELYTMDALFALYKRGEISDGKTVAALLHCKLFLKG